METEPVAAPQGTEATSINSNEQAPADAQKTEAPLTADIPADKIEAFNKFVNSNGGFEKAFAKLKSDVSTPAPQTPSQDESQAQAQPQTQPQAVAEQKPSIPNGFVTMEELGVQNYFEGLARKSEYSAIADKIRNGDVFKEMAKFGIVISQNGAINTKQIGDFLDMYAKTVPTPVPSAPVTNTPTVDYVKVGEQISSRDEALKILQQNMDLGKKGIAPHPQTEAAKEYLKNYFNKK